eukprot:TRINITY_DN11567_c0_g2_i1.p1 TRINITY_DN11567_c0_g2~~TRINITY_DN11567_c0_g2_i1.p1  ORF type:complete len:219 (+),score=57.81 TRINITY_DN11567_c0_g2_i1:58-657(+)
MGCAQRTLAVVAALLGCFYFLIFNLSMDFHFHSSRGRYSVDVHEFGVNPMAGKGHTEERLRRTDARVATSLLHGRHRLSVSCDGPPVPIWVNAALRRAVRRTDPHYHPADALPPRWLFFRMSNTSANVALAESADHFAVPLHYGRELICDVWNRPTAAAAASVEAVCGVAIRRLCWFHPGTDGAVSRPPPITWTLLMCR